MGRKATRRDAQDQPGVGKDAELEGREAPLSGRCSKGWIDARSKGPGYMELPTFDDKATADPNSATQEGRGSPRTNSGESPRRPQGSALASSCPRAYK